MCRVLWRVGPLALVAACGCAELDPMQEGICGNGVVEAHEDCDRFPQDGCIPPGAEHECRFACTRDGDENTPDCPAGFNCGVDGICRQPSGTFLESLLAPVLAPSAPRLFVEDFDADGLDDVVVEGTTRTQVYFMAEDGAVAQTTTLPPVVSPPAVGRLTASDRRDVAAVDRGLMVSRGQTDRSILPTVYTPVLIDEEHFRFVGMDARPEEYLVFDPANPDETPEFAGDELMVILHDDYLGNVLVPSRSLGDYVPLPDDIHIPDLVQHPPAGQLDARTPCEEVVLAEESSDHVVIISPCRPSGFNVNEFDWNDGSWPPATEGPYPPVNLPPQYHLIDPPSDAAELGRVELIDVDRVLVDSAPTPDIVTGAVGPSGDFELCVAFGIGEGRFQSEPFDSVSTGDNTFRCEPLPAGQQWPLAVGHLNDDAKIDLVLPGAILMSQKRYGDDQDSAFWVGQIDYYVAYRPVDPWKRAQVADFNQNGSADVSGVAEDRPELTFLNGDGRGAFSEYSVSLRGFVEEMFVGDFDGDFLPDLALFDVRSERSTGDEPPGTPPGGDDEPTASAPSVWLSVAFSNTAGAPNEPIDMGKLDGLESALVANIQGRRQDAIDDLLTTSPPNAEGVRAAALWAGWSERFLLAPFTFALLNSAQQPVAVAIGQFDSDEQHDDLAVITVPASEAPGWPALWLAPCTGEAELDAATASNRSLPEVWVDGPGGEPLPLPVLVDGAMPAAVDLDPDGIDELVVFATTAVIREEDQPNGGAADMLGLPPRGVIEVARAGVNDQGLQAWTDLTASATDALFQYMPDGPSHLDRMPAVLGMDPKGDIQFRYAMYDGQVAVVDVDRDELKDVVVLAASLDWDADATLMGAWTQVRVYRNLGSGMLDLANPIAVAAPDGLDPTAFAFLNIDDDAALEMAIATESAIWVGDLDLGNAAQGTASLADAKSLQIAGGYRLASGDFNGDGVTDLCVSDTGRVRLLLAKPAD